jgi:hypothetical protein
MGYLLFVVVVAVVSFVAGLFVEAKNHIIGNL